MKCLILCLTLIIFLIWSNDFIVILVSSDIFLSCRHYIIKVGPPDFKLHSELTLLKNFVSHNAKGISSLPKLHDALWESMADHDVGGIVQLRNKANSTYMVVGEMTLQEMCQNEKTLINKGRDF